MPADPVQEEQSKRLFWVIQTVFSFVIALAVAAYGWLQRSELGVVLLVGYLPAAVFLGVELLSGAG